MELAVKRGGLRQQKTKVALPTDPAKQVEEYIKVSKETSSVAYELACIAQDLGSLYSNKYNDEKSVTADQLIEGIVGDRVPFTFGKRGSDTIPSGLQALGQFLQEDPRHHGVRLSALFTGGNYIQERGQRHNPTEPDTKLETFYSSEDSSSEGSSSSDESAHSVESEEIENFDAHKWHTEVAALLAEIQSKKEWETMAALREMYIFKDSERAADIVHVEALAELNDGELRGFDKTREELETQVEAKQLDMLQTLSTFNKTLKSTTTEIIRRRHARKKAAAKAKRFSFADMDEVVLVEKEEKGDEEDDADRRAEEEKRNKGNRSGMILEHISGLQKSINDLVHDTHQSKLSLEVHNEALVYLTLAMEAAEGGGEAPEAKEEVRDLLKNFQDEAKQIMDAQKRAQADALLQQAATSSVSDVSEESLKQQTPEELKVTLMRAEGEVQLLQTKIQEIEQARITAAHGGSDRIQKAKKAVQLQEQNSEKAAKGEASTSSKDIRSAIDADAKRKKQTEPAAVMPLHQLMAKLEDQLPAAQQVLEDLTIHRDKFMQSVEKAQQLRERLFVDRATMERRVSQPEVNVGKAVLKPAEVPKAGQPRRQPKEPKPVEMQRPQLSPEEVARQEEFQKLNEEVEKWKEKLQTLSSHFSKVMGTEVGVDTLTEDVTAAILEDKESEQRQKQEQIAQLRAELQELQGLSHAPAIPRPVAAPVGQPSTASAGSASPKHDTPRSGEGSPGRARRTSQSQRASQANLQDLMNGNVDPELMQQLLAAQGETLNIQEQVNSIEELIKLLRNKGDNLGPEEKQQIKDLMGKPDIKNDKSSEAAALREEKKKIRELEKQVGERRDQWNDIEGASKVLRGLAEGNMTQGELMKKVRMVKAAYVRTGDIAETGTGSSEMGTLQAAAALARTAHRRRNSDVQVTLPTSPAASPRRFSETSRRLLGTARSGVSEASAASARSSSGAPVARSASVEVDDLLDGLPVAPAVAPAVPAVALAAPADQESQGQHPPGGSSRNQRRRSSGGQLMGGIIEGVGQVGLQVAVNMRRRHSLAAGMRQSQQQANQGSPLKLRIAGRGSEAGQAMAAQQGAGDRTLGALNLSPRRASV